MEPIAIYERLKLVAVSRIEGLEHFDQTGGLISNRIYHKLRRQGIREVKEEDIRIKADRMQDLLLNTYA